MYIHYGHNKFDKSKFTEIKNRPYMTKPFGGLWASRKDSEDGWKNWVTENELSLGNFKTSFEFNLKQDAKILIIDNIEILKTLPQVKSDRRLALWYFLDFEQLSKEYDAVEVLISEDRELYFKLYGWDCDSLLVMNPDIIEELNKTKNLKEQELEEEIDK